MSHYIMKSLSINQKKNTYSVCCRTNNVSPSYYQTFSGESLDRLLYEISTWIFQYHWKNNKLKSLVDKAYEIKNEYEKDWSDLYEENHRTKKSTDKYIEANKELIHFISLS